MQSYGTQTDVGVAAGLKYILSLHFCMTRTVRTVKCKVRTVKSEPVTINTYGPIELLGWYASLSLTQTTPGMMLGPMGCHESFWLCF